MAKKRATAVKTLDDFIDEVNRCDYGRYEIGLNNEFGASYIITACEINPERHLFSLRYASTGNDIN